MLVRRVVEIKLELKPRWTGKLLAPLLLAGLCETASLDSKLESYYPPPAAVFKTLSSTHLTELAYDQGNLILLGPNNANGAVGIGTISPDCSRSPEPGGACLHVNGHLNVTEGICIDGKKVCSWADVDTGVSRPCANPC